MIFPLKSLLLAILAIMTISGCKSLETKPQLAKISDAESTKYIDSYLNEYNKSISGYRDNSKVKWVQASNKKEECKVYIEYSDVDFTLQNNFKINWDGDCKDGYASGLGREFKTGSSIDITSIVVYEGEPRKEPKYYIVWDHLNNHVQEGDINNQYAVVTTVNNVDFNLIIHFGYFGEHGSPALITRIEPIISYNLYQKTYPNFSYHIKDYSRDELALVKLKVGTSSHNSDESWTSNGFNVQVDENNTVSEYETSNGNVLRMVELPQSYKDKMIQIQHEVRQAGLRALSLQKKALLIKEQYKNKICPKATPPLAMVAVHVDFMDSNKYTEICREDAYYAELKRKIDAQIAARNHLIQQKKTAAQQQQKRASEARAKQVQQNNNSVHPLEGLALLMQAFADGVNGSSTTYSAPAYQAPSLPDLQVQNSSPTYKSTTGNRYKYDLNKPSDRILYNADIKAQIIDGLDPSIAIDNRLGEHGGGIEVD